MMRPFLFVMILVATAIAGSPSAPPKPKAVATRYIHERYQRGPQGKVVKREEMTREAAVEVAMFYNAHVLGRASATPQGAPSDEELRVAIERWNQDGGGAMLRRSIPFVLERIVIETAEEEVQP